MNIEYFCRKLRMFNVQLAFVPTFPGGLMINHYFRIALSASLLISVFALSSFSQSSKKWAVVNGETITEEQVKKAAAEDLEDLELRKMQAQLGFQRDEQTIYEKTLARIVDNKLL